MTSPSEPASTLAQRVVASYPDHGSAERAVDYLSENGFPVERSAIVGRGLEMVERITGRVGYGSAAGHAAASGAVVGAVIGWLFGIFSWIDPLIAGLWLALWGAIIGAVIGVIVGLIGHAVTSGRRDFGAQSYFRASSYDLLVEAGIAEEASRLLTPARE